MRYFLAIRSGNRGLSLSPFAFRLGPAEAGRPYLEELTGACPHLLGDGRATDHPRNFFNSSCVVESIDTRHRPGAAHGLLDEKLRRAACRNLRQVRNAQYLEALS